MSAQPPLRSDSASRREDFRSRLLSLLMRDLLGSGIGVRLRVTGRSMAPCLADGDVVTLQPVDPSRIALGDLIYTEEPGQRPRLHRVVARGRGPDGGSFLRTKGDALPGPDPPAPGASVVGRVVRIHRLDSVGQRETRLEGPRRRLLHMAIALASRHAPRAFAALSRRVLSRPRHAG